MNLLLNNTEIEVSDFSDKIFGSGLSIYEVIRVFNHKPIFLNDNLMRLSNSIKKSNLDIEVSNLDIKNKLQRFIALENISEGNLKYVLHIVSDRTDEYLYQIPHSYPSEENYQNGVKTITLHAVRENPEVKYVNESLRELTNKLIRENQVYEILLIDNEEYITEGSRSNVFFIQGNTLYTASVQHVLPGTCRKRVIDICKDNGIALKEERTAYSSVQKYDAAFITGTSPLILPIRQIDNFMFNTNNQLLRRLMNIYFALLKNNF